MRLRTCDSHGLQRYKSRLLNSFQILVMWEVMSLEEGLRLRKLVSFV